MKKIIMILLCVTMGAAFSVDAQNRIVKGKIEMAKKSRKGTTQNHSTNQTPRRQKVQDEPIYAQVEEIAQFPGGMTALMTWLASNIRYPENAVNNRVMGKVLVKFVVEIDGSIGDVEIIKGVDEDLDNEALRVVRAMPNWIPGKLSGRTVRSYFNLPINFRL